MFLLTIPLVSPSQEKSGNITGINFNLEFLSASSISILVTEFSFGWPLIIKPSKKCQSCDKSDDCEFLKHLFQKPYDASGVILDCKAFYYVFCDLEERCCVHIKDSEKKRQYYIDLEEGKQPFLDPAMITNGVLAVELALKALTFQETGTFDFPFGVLEVQKTDENLYSFVINGCKVEKAFTLPVCVRNIQNGDKIFTAQKDYKKVVDIFKDWQIPEEMRSKVPLVQNIIENQDLLCILGKGLGFKDWIVK